MKQERREMAITKSDFMKERDINLGAIAKEIEKRVDRQLAMYRGENTPPPFKISITCDDNPPEAIQKALARYADWGICQVFLGRNLIIYEFS